MLVTRVVVLLKFGLTFKTGLVINLSLFIITISNYHDK